MRISDWSSDVCSSDLIVGDFIERVEDRGDAGAVFPSPRQRIGHLIVAETDHHCDVVNAVGDQRIELPVDQRSEEHTSELQSLMRISYAVFCLKKKNTQTQHQYDEQTQSIHNTPQQDY